MGFRRNRTAPQSEGQCFVLGGMVGGGVENEGHRPQSGIFHPFPAQGEAVHDGHENVRNDQVRLLFAGHLKGFMAVARPNGLVALPSQDDFQEPQVGFVVVHDQDSNGFLHRFAPFLAPLLQFSRRAPILKINL